MAATPGGKPPVRVELHWDGDLRFAGRAGDVQVTLDGSGASGPSPTQALALGLAGCMAIDVLDVLQKGRFEVRGLEARLVGERRPEPPRYFVRIDLHFVVQGAIPPDRVERAIALSRERYCSVWHSLRPDIDFQASFEVT